METSAAVPILRDLTIKKSLAGVGVAIGAVTIRYGVAFSTQLFLVRLLTPEQFGIFAIATVVTMFFNGFTTVYGEKYIVCEPEHNQTKLDNVFTVELVLALFFIIVLCVGAPLVASVTGRSEVVPYVRVLSLVFLANPFSKPLAVFDQRLDFARSNGPQLISQFLGGVVALSLAYAGYGVWSLVWWRVASVGFLGIATWAISDYRPRLAFDRNIVSAVLRFGWPLMASGILIFIYNNADYYIVGRLLDPQQLGYYWLAYETSQYFLKAKSAINSVVLPTFAALRNENDVKHAFELLTKSTALLYLVPTLVVLGVGGDLVSLVFGEQWRPAGAPFQIFMVLALIRAATAYGENIYIYRKRTGISFVLSCIYLVTLAPAVYLFTLRFGIHGAALGVLLANVIVTIVGSVYVYVLISHNMLYLVRMIVIPCAVVGVLSALGIVGGGSPFLTLTACGIASIAMYYSVRDEVNYVWRNVSAAKALWSNAEAS